MSRKQKREMESLKESFRVNDLSDKSHSKFKNFYLLWKLRGNQ